MKQLYWAMGYLGTAFCLVFTGFNVAQSYITTLFPGSFGFIILTIVYACFGFSSILLSPFIHRYLTEKSSMALAGVPYCVFVVSLISGLEWFVIISSVLVGLGAGLLWVSQGVYLAKMIRAHTAFLQKTTGTASLSNVGVVGKATGLFFCNSNGLIGNAIAIAALASGAEFSAMIYIMFAICGLGGLMLFFSPNIPKSFTEPEPVADKSAASGGWRKFLSHTKTRLLTPYLICQGYNIAYNFGNFPTFVNHASAFQTQSVSTRNIAIIFLFYGVGSIIGSWVWGWMYDRNKSHLTPLITSHLILCAACYVILVIPTIIDINYDATIYGFLTLNGFLFGLIDNLTNTVINSSNTKLYRGNELQKSFAWYRVCFCIGFTAETLISSVLAGVEIHADENPRKYEWVIMIVLGAVLMLISAVCALALEMIIMPRERNRVQDISDKGRLKKSAVAFTSSS